jgi:hypothetical protein
LTLEVLTAADFAIVDLVCQHPPVVALNPKLRTTAVRSAPQDIRLSEATFRSQSCIADGFFPSAHVRGVREPFSNIDPSSGTERRSGESVQAGREKP